MVHRLKTNKQPRAVTLTCKVPALAPREVDGLHFHGCQHQAQEVMSTLQGLDAGLTRGIKSFLAMDEASIMARGDASTTGWVGRQTCCSSMRKSAAGHA